MSASATITIAKKGKVPPPPPTEKRKFSWSGVIVPNKWTVFYTKVLARFANSSKLKINVSFENEDEVVVTDQKIEETKTALKELGLD